MFYSVLVIIGCFNHFKTVLNCGTGLRAISTFKCVHCIVACNLHFAPEEITLHILRSETMFVAGWINILKRHSEDI